MTSLAQHYDVIIVGGGMVGASFAALLPENLSILLIESFALPENPLQGYQPSYDGRSTALAHSSYKIFEKAGIWSYLQPYVEPITDVHVSDKGHWGSVALSHEEQQWQALGYVVENALLGRSLLHVVQQKSNITFYCPAKVNGIQVLSDGVKVRAVQGEQEQNFTANLLAIADGAQSDSCKMLGIEHQVRSYGHTAIVANLSTDKPHCGIAYERFTPNGPIAILPQRGTDEVKNRSVLIWTLPEQEAHSMLQLDDAAFLAELQQRFGHWQGQFVSLGKRVHYPLKLSRAEEQVRRHIVVLGNAAHSLHPVAGQGFNLALRDVAMLAQLLEKAQQDGLSIGSLPILNHYLKQQLGDQDLTILFSDQLPTLFAQSAPWLQLGRNLGLLGLELMPALKRPFTRFAAGWRS